MKRNNKIKYSLYAILAATTFSLNSCKIDVIPQDRYSEDVIWSDPSTIELYVNGLYSEFKNFQFGLFPNLGYTNAMDALADGMKFTSTAPGNGTVNILISSASQFSASSVGLNYWGTGYARIRRINEFINGLYTKSLVPDEDKARYEAEARFIRAYCYSWLAKLHGSVIILKDLNEYSTKDRQRSSEGEVYDFMIEDLKFAAENLPKTQLRGRATKGAANALLSRVALYAGSIAKYDQKLYNSDPLTGIESNKASSYFTISSQAAQAVIADGLYELDANFSTLFTNRNSKEGILTVDFVAPNVTHQYDFYYAPPRDLEQPQVHGVPTAELVDEFEMADGSKFSWSNAAHRANPYANREPRFYATILHNGMSWKGRQLNTTTNDASEGFIAYGTTGDPRRTVTGYYAKKFLDEKNTNIVVNRSTQSWIELRYAEVILNLAEAQAQLGDFTASAATLNQLRSKRGSAQSTLQSVYFNTNTTAMEAIEHERIVELAFEGHRFWDLRRWRKAHIVLNNTRMTGHKITPEGSAFKYESVAVDNVNREFTGKLYYLPILEDEIQKNLALTQIQGW